MLASRVVTSTMLMIEPPLASYLNPLSLVGFQLPTLKPLKSREKENIGARRCQEGGLASALTAVRDSMRMARRSVLVASRFLF
jgi:hypothetical protein